MPRVKRSPDEIQAVRDDISNHALDLIATYGYERFSMRKLARRLGIAAKTIYNYFHNQDEIYLRLLTRGFEQLYGCLESAIADHKDPMDRLAAAIRAYVDYGLDNANIYSLMFTWHVPKYKDYIGTPMETEAHHEWTTSQRCAELFLELIRSCIGNTATPTEDTLRYEMILIWAQMQGYIAGINNTLLDYLHESPIYLKERVVDRIINNTRRALQDRQDQSQ